MILRRQAAIWLCNTAHFWNYLENQRHRERAHSVDLFLDTSRRFPNRPWNRVARLAADV